VELLSTENQDAYDIELINNHDPLDPNIMVTRVYK